MERMAGITDKVLPSIEPGDILDSARNLERIDYVARRNFRLDQQPPAGGGIHIGVLTGQVAIQYMDCQDSQDYDAKLLAQSIAFRQRLRRSRAVIIGEGCS
jgi:hypothetical protein